MIGGFLWITTKEELNECYFVRKKVFLDEQGFSYDADEIDDVAHHILFLDDDKPVGTARLFMDEGHWHIGRVATLKEYRGKGIGKFMINTCLDKAKELGESDTVILGSQYDAKDFYLKLGFEEYGEIFYEESCPHIMMKKII